MAEPPTVPVYNATPTVRVKGQENAQLTASVIAMQMTESEGGMSALELRVNNWGTVGSGGPGMLWEDGSVLALGHEIAVYGGDVNAPVEIFRGVITGLEGDFPQDGSPELVVLAEDAFQRARMARRTKTHENATLKKLASDLADSLGLSAVVTGLGDSIGTQVQLNESDLAFLRRMLSRYDADLQVVGDQLQVSPRGDVQRGAVELALPSPQGESTQPNKTQLQRARVLTDLAHQATEVAVDGWDPAQGQRVNAKGAGSNLGPGSGRTGAQLLQAQSQTRSERLGHLAATTQGEAQALADAAFDARARRLVCLEGTAQGNPTLRVGTHIKVSGMGPRFDNTYYVTRAVHRYDQTHGYVTDFEAECAYLGGG